MATGRQIRFAFVEYQPNLERPTDPVPLGVVVEDIGGEYAQVGILGRVPVGDHPELQLDEAWGPFREVVTGWQEAILKSVREAIVGVEVGDSVLNHVANQWRWNLYLTTPAEETVSADANLRDIAKRKFEELTDVLIQFPSDKPETVPSRQDRTLPWLKSQSFLEGDRRAVPG